MEDNIQIKSITLYNIEQKIFWALVCLIAFSLVFYVSLVRLTIVHIVERTTAELAIRDSESKIAELEAQFTTLGKSVDVNFAKDMGYQEISKIDYVSRSPVLTMLDGHVR